MSFFALTGLKVPKDISTTSNNIANVGSSFKKSRAEFGDIFSTTFANEYSRKWCSVRVDNSTVFAR